MPKNPPPVTLPPSTNSDKHVSESDVIQWAVVGLERQIDDHHHLIARLKDKIATLKAYGIARHEQRTPVDVVLPPADDDVLTVKEAGELLGKHPTTFNREIRNGRLKATKRQMANGPYQWVIARSEYERWLSTYKPNQRRQG